PPPPRQRNRQTLGHLEEFLADPSQPGSRLKVLDVQRVLSNYFRSDKLQQDAGEVCVGEITYLALLREENDKRTLGLIAPEGQFHCRGAVAPPAFTSPPPDLPQQGRCRAFLFEAEVIARLAGFLGLSEVPTGADGNEGATLNVLYRAFQRETMG